MSTTLSHFMRTADPFIEQVIYYYKERKAGMGERKGENEVTAGELRRKSFHVPGFSAY